MWKTRCLWFCLWAVVSVGVAVAYTVAQKPITEACLGCMCEALSGCNATAICVNGACGIFRLTWEQWVDSGRLTLPGESPLFDSSFKNCANDPICAANTLQSYMFKYGQDCNQDKEENCLDYNAIHYMGPYNCQADMPYNYESVFNKCIKRVQQQQQSQI